MAPSRSGITPARKASVPSYERYLNRAYSDSGATGTISKVWFSIAQGIVTETAWGKIHEGQIKDLQFLVTGTGFFDEEKVATDSTIEYLHTDGSGRPLSLAYKITNTDKQGKYWIVKDIFTDPNRQALFMRVTFSAFEKGITPYILINPAIANTGNQDVAYVKEGPVRPVDRPTASPRRMTAEPGGLRGGDRHDPIPQARILGHLATMSAISGQTRSGGHLVERGPIDLKRAS